LLFSIFVVSFFYYYSLFLLLYSIGLRVDPFVLELSSIYSSFGLEFFSFVLYQPTILFCFFQRPFVCWVDLVPAAKLACPLPLPRTVIRSAVPLAQGPYLFVPIICWIIFASFFYQFLSSSYSMLSHSISLGIINRITSVLQLALILLYLIQ
jgi:hypothetical protein